MCVQTDILQYSVSNIKINTPFCIGVTHTNKQVKIVNKNMRELAKGRNLWQCNNEKSFFLS